MSTMARVVWSEGMHLAQHHFQAQNRYFEELIAFTVESLFFKPYGLVGCVLDDEALLNGTVSVLHARGVLPDGLAFHFPEDATPPPIEIRELFSPTQDAHLVMLAIPVYRSTRPNCADENSANGATRFVAQSRAVVDETTGTDQRNVGIAGKNFRLLLDHQVTEDVVAMPIARVRRDGSGHFVYDPEYIPPVLHVGASRRLLGMLERLTQILDAKADALALERGGDRSALREYGRSEVASFWLSHAVHASLAPLRNVLHTPEIHPERLYVELARLAGALCTFSLTSHPRSIPLYDHDRLDQCFAALDRHIRDHLAVLIATNVVTIALQPTAQPFFLTGEVTDRRCFARAEWFLGVRSTGSTAEVLARVPKVIKVCAEKHIVRLVQEAYPGLTLEHVVSPPTALPVRVGAHYFRIQQAGPCWSSLIDTAQVGVFAPDAIPNAELELLVLLEGGG